MKYVPYMVLSLPFFMGCAAFAERIQAAGEPGGLFDAIAVTVGTVTGNPVAGGILKAVGVGVAGLASLFVVKKTHAKVKARRTAKVVV